MILKKIQTFDTVVFTEERLIGVEVKPEFSLTEFQHALGEVIKHLLGKFWRIRIEEGKGWTAKKMGAKTVPQRLYKYCVEHPHELKE
jgi:hypothetical protein